MTHEELELKIGIFRDFTNLFHVILGHKRRPLEDLL